MTAPAKLRFRAWRKPEVVFTLQGWHPLKGMAIVVDPKGDRQAISLVLPGMHAQGPLGLLPTFPGALPAEIEEITLLPPPCRTTRQEEETLRAEAAQARRSPTGAAPRGSPHTPDWEDVWLQHRDIILLPIPEDDPRLKKRLAAFKIKMQRRYEARKAELEQWRTKTIGQMMFLGGGRFYKWTGTSLVESSWPVCREESHSHRKSSQSKPINMSKEVEKNLGFLESTFTRPLSGFLGRPHGGYLNWTLEVARHEPAIRDRVLHRRWASETGINLAEMQSEEAAFLHWYRAMWPHSPAPSRQPTSFFGLLLLLPEQDARLADIVLCAEVRYRVRFADGSRVWLADCPLRQPLLTPGEQWFGNSLNVKPSDAPAPTAPAQHWEAVVKRIDDVGKATADTLTVAGEALAKAGQQARADVEAGAATLGARTEDLAAERQQFEAVPGKLAVASQRIEAATAQLTAKTKALDEVISPLNRLYSDVELAEIRKRAFGKEVPDLLVDWVFMQFLKSDPPKLPTKGDAFNNCGPGTLIGKKLEQAGFGISKQRFADHLTVIRRLLEEKGWLARRTPGKTRKRESHFRPDERLEDFNQPTPAESAEDREEERQAAGLDIQEEEDQQQSGDSDRRSDAD